MMLICGQSNRIWHYWAGRYPGSVGVLISPSYKHIVPIDKWMPFALDNDAYICWKKNLEWNYVAWIEMLDWVKMTGLVPLWAAVPDVVTNRQATIANWGKYSHEIKRRGWKAAFCAQDGMNPNDVPDDADVVFVGGSDGWKFPNLRMWTDNFPRVHCARVTSIKMIEACERLGCESVDSTGWFRAQKDHIAGIEAFIEGHRNNNELLKGLELHE